MQEKRWLVIYDPGIGQDEEWRRKEECKRRFMEIDAELTLCVVEKGSCKCATKVRIWSQAWLPPFSCCHESVQSRKVPGCQHKKGCDAGALLCTWKCGLQKPGLLPKLCVEPQPVVWWYQDFGGSPGLWLPSSLSLPAHSSLCGTAHCPLSCADKSLAYQCYRAGQKIFN